MLLQRFFQISKPFSTSSPLAWRTRIKQDHLVSQISSLLLQRRDWAPLLQTHDLSSKLTPFIFYQILRITQNDPQLSVNFFNWAKTKLGFEPDLRSQCHIICLLLKNSQPVRSMLDSLVKHHKVSVLVDSMVRASKGSDFDFSTALSVVLQSYAYNGLYKEGMEAFNLIRMHGIVPSVSACNTLLDALLRKNEMEWGWCFVGAMIRSGVSQDKPMWNSIAMMLSKEGKFDRIGYLWDMGIESSVIYNLVIDSYSKRGDFSGAFDRLGKMYDKNIDAGFSTYSSILDGSCKFNEKVVTERILEKMMDKKLLPDNSPLEDNLMIQKLCDLGRSYAAEMFFSRALEKWVGLEAATYGCMLRSFSKDGRVKEAIGMYQMISGSKNITVKDNCYVSFLSALCRGEPCKEISNIIRDMIGRGFSPPNSDLSNYLASLCKKRRWFEVEYLLNVILDKRLPIDFSCCGSLIKRYCAVWKIDKAIELHDKIEVLEGSLDVVAYNKLLEGTMKQRKIAEADKIFEYMRRRNLASSTSFAIMVHGLCHLKELRKAMMYHDEMLQRGLKPDKARYKRLITGFT